ncbi:MAG: coproporphyrinogen III oxidase, partial [Bacteroidia bacterium]|nr:coproporphyrinogen III oxidase [Bacteroidia bacterium]
MLTKEHITEWFKELQDSICHALEKEDGKGKFEEDNWVREEGGGGRTRIIQNGNVIEKGGVNFSAVFGEVPTFLKNEHNSAQLNNHTFYATGVSIV